MRDLMMIGFMLFLIGAAMARPFLMTMAYIYVDLVSPQRITFYLLSSIPLSMIMAILAVLFFLLFEEKKGLGFDGIQMIMLILVVWITITTFGAALPEFAWVKWSDAWKSVGFSIFLPFVLRTRQRIEVALLFTVLSVAVITISGGLKTLGGGGGYGKLNLLVTSNSGLYEGSTIANVAITMIPIILYLYKHTTLFPRNFYLKAVVAGLIFAAILITIGTEARTGLICLAVFGVLLFVNAQRKILTFFIVLVIAVAGMPFLPSSFTSRMSTIKTHNEDTSASTRVAVWRWTMDYAKTHPLGGGFEVYRTNNIEYDVETASGGTEHIVDKARAFHSAFFQMLGEHGYIGLVIFLVLAGTALVKMQLLRRRFRYADADTLWIPDLAKALFQSIIIYLAGSSFVAIAFQTTLYLLYALCVSALNAAAKAQKAGVVANKAPTRFPIRGSRVVVPGVAPTRT